MRRNAAGIIRIRLIALILSAAMVLSSVCFVSADEAVKEETVQTEAAPAVNESTEQEAGSEQETSAAGTSEAAEAVPEQTEEQEKTEEAQPETVPEADAAEAEQQETAAEEKTDEEQSPAEEEQESEPETDETVKEAAEEVSVTEKDSQDEETVQEEAVQEEDIQEEKSSPEQKTEETSQDPEDTGSKVTAVPEEKKASAPRVNAGSVDDSTQLADGEYTDFEWTWEGGTGKARLILDKIVVSGGKATGYFTASSTSMTHVYYLGHTGSDSEDTAYYDPATGTCGTGVAAIVSKEVSFPVCLNEKMQIACRTTAMSVPHWVQYEYTITIDETEKENVTALEVSNTVEDLTISAAELGVMEKSGRTTLRMTAGDSTFTKFFSGTAAKAREDDAKIIALSDDMVFSVSDFKADAKTAVSFYSEEDGIWHDAYLKADTSAKTLTLTEGKKADYSKVESAKAKVPADLSVYMEERVKTLNDALEAVVEGLYASEQDRVDAFAEAIEKAIEALEKEKLTIKFKAVDQETGKKIKTAVFKVKNAKGKTVKAESDGVYSLENGTYTITASAENYEDAVLEDYTPSVEETVTLKLEPKEIIPEGTIIFRENEKDPSKTNLFNTTAMFKVVKGTLVSNKSKTTLTVSLSGQGYHYLYKGTYEEALENGMNKKNWIKGTVNSDGKWEFVIPLSESETFIPIVAISEARLEKVKSGEAEFGSAIFARQLVLDLKEETLTAGDYNEILEITVISRSGNFKAAKTGTMEVVGGPSSNNYACKPVITMTDTRFSRAFIGTAENAAKSGAKVIKRKNNTFTFEFVNSFGSSGKVVTFEDKKPIAVAFYDTSLNEWTDYKLTIDKSAETVTIEALKEDEAPPEEPEQQEEYKDDSDRGTSAVDSDTTLADGVYTPKSFTFSGGTGKVVIFCDKLEVIGGQAYATLRFAKPHGGTASVDMLRANGNTYSGNNVFTIPVELNANNTIVARTTAMSQPHWIEYSIFIALDEPGKETEGADVSENTTEMDTEAPAILGLASVGETEIVYSDLLRIFNYEDGYYLIEVDAVRDTARDTVEYRTVMELEALAEKTEQKEDTEEETEEEILESGEEESSETESISDMIAGLYENEILKYLVIPEGKEVPAGLDKEVLIISQPTDKTYVSSSEALQLLDELGVISDIQSVGFEKDETEIPSVLAAMEGEDASIVYGGAFDDWDLRSMITGHTNFAVEDARILPREEKTIEEDMENLVRLGQRSVQMEMAMFIDRSADETNELAKAEWYKVYGVIFGQTEKAASLYQKAVDEASEKEKTEAEELLKTRAEEKSGMKTEAKAAAEKQMKEGA